MPESKQPPNPNAISTQATQRGADGTTKPVPSSLPSEDFPESVISATPKEGSTQGREKAETTANHDSISPPPNLSEAMAGSNTKVRSPRRGGGQRTGEPRPDLATPHTLLPINTFPNPEFPASAELGTDPSSLPPNPATVSKGQFLPLRLHAEMYEDAVKAFVAISNRASRSDLDPDIYAQQVKLMKSTKEALGKALVVVYRQVVPQEIIEWQESTPALGAHTLARLLGLTGHPRIALPHHWEGSGEDRVLVADEPHLRTIGQFRAYCGHGDPSRKRRKEMSAGDAAALGSPRAKMVTYLLADAARKNRNSPYRMVYDLARVKYAERDWTLGHQDAAAMRKVGKEILKDLWQVAPAPLTPLPARKETP